MKLKTTLIFISAILLLAAASPGDAQKGKLKSINMDKWGDTLTYQYDAEGRVTSHSSANRLKTTYTYQGKTIIAKTGSSVITMFLNSRGLVDSLTDIDTNRITIYDANGNEVQTNFGMTRIIPYSGNQTLDLDEIAGVTSHGIISFSKKFTYDDAGYIKEVRVYLSSGRQIVCTNTVVNGNIVSYSVKYPIDTIHQFNTTKKRMDTLIIMQNDFTVKNTFDAEKMNTLAINPFFGKSSKNIMLRSVKYQPPAGIPSDSNVTTFKYTFDKENRVSTLITTVKTNDPPEEKMYSERPDTCSFTYY
jgi:YD repeat-containing protein